MSNLRFMLFPYLAKAEVERSEEEDMAITPRRFVFPGMNRGLCKLAGKAG
jgi:hypothetical protein